MTFQFYYRTVCRYKRDKYNSSCNPFRRAKYRCSNVSLPLRFGNGESPVRTFRDLSRPPLGFLTSVLIKFNLDSSQRNLHIDLNFPVSTLCLRVASPYLPKIFTQVKYQLFARKASRKRIIINRNRKGEHCVGKSAGVDTFPLRLSRGITVLRDARVFAPLKWKKCRW